MTPLMLAAQSGHVEMVAMLLEHGADVNAQNVKSGRPDQCAFHFACGAGQLSVVRALMDAGCDSGTRDAEGRTGQDYAWQIRHQSMLPDGRNSRGIDQVVFMVLHF